MNPRPQLSPGVLALAAIVGIIAGFSIQMTRSSNGVAPFAPPVSLPATLVVIAILLIVFGVRLQRALQPESKRVVEPIHAVRLLAAGRASQITGLLCGGFGGGLLVYLTTRTVGVQIDVWLPMLLTLIAGLVLFGAGLYAEYACRVPPTDPDEQKDEGEEPESGRLLA